MKHRILYVLSSLGTGGTCRALQNTLNLFDTDKYQVDVFVMVHDGLYNGEFKNCNVLKPDYLLSVACPSYYTLKGINKLVGYSIKFFNKLFNKRLVRLLMKRKVNALIKKNEYDALVAYSEGLPTYFVSEAEHSNKIAWIHCDYKNYLQMIDVQEHSIYERFTKIICVSDFTRKTFVDVYPDLAFKTHFIYNVLDVNYIRKMSLEPYSPSYGNDVVNIISVGRIDPVKRFSSIPAIADLLRTKHSFRWYILGPAVGNNEEYLLLMENIKKYNVHNEIILLGEKSNPYPYIANADILACTSVSEACPYVINEAKILDIPVVCTNFGSSYEFISDNENGLIVSLDKFHVALDKLMDNRNLYDCLKSNLEFFHYDNEKILSSIYSLFSKKRSE